MSMLLAERETTAAVDAGTGYQLRLADSSADLRAAQRLRFDVFNLEMGEGLASSYVQGLDSDQFDAACDHLLVLDKRSQRVVGTYRLQTGEAARAAHGYYGEREFDFGPYESMRGQLIELGRACIDARHRSFAVLNLLWCGIAAYARERGARYLIGCSSLTSSDEGEGAAAWQQLQPHVAHPTLLTRPRESFACALDHFGPATKIPRLLAAYLALGARICSPPAIDREFGSIDFLTWLDLTSPAAAGFLRRAGRAGSVVRR